MIGLLVKDGLEVLKRLSARVLLKVFEIVFLYLRFCMRREEVLVDDDG